MRRVQWRWGEKDFGFRFRNGVGRTTAEYYQSTEPGSFYIVPARHRKLHDDRIDELSSGHVPSAPRIVATPWLNYERDWDWIRTEGGILLNYAGCLDREEIHRREDEGVARAMEHVASMLSQAKPVALSSALIQQVHTELMGAIYPFAGSWRTVSLHKGDGPTKWPLPPGGIQLFMDLLDRDVFSRAPLISADDREVFAYVGEVMGEILAIHPFRDGNGRTAFTVGNLLLMQNDLLPLGKLCTSQPAAPRKR